MKKIIATTLIGIALILSIFSLTSCGNVKNIKLSFIVDDEVYDIIETTGNENITIPDNPYKVGYSFDGWYWDNGTWEKPFTANSLIDTPISSNIQLYAKFKHLICNFTEEIIICPTCTEKGYTLLKCECGESKKNNYVNTINHNFDEWIIREEATTYAEGKKDRICKTCGYVEQETISKKELTIVFNPDLNEYIEYEFDIPLTTVNPLPNLEYDNAEVKIDVVGKVYYVVFDEMPENYNSNINDLIIDTLNENNIVIEDFENFDFKIFVKDEFEIPIPLE